MACRWKTAWLIFALWWATGIASQAQTFTTLHTFENSDGSFPLRGSCPGT